MPGVTLDRVTKAFAGSAVVRAVSLEIEDGEFIVLVGPSGCGKTTLLRTIAGLEGLTDGAIHIGERDVTRLPPKERDVAMIFQDYALYPQMSVAENLGIGLKLRGVRREERRRRVLQVAELLGLEHLLNRRPSQLSGGQQQRVAIGRAVVREPRVYLMDEPLSNLDAKLRVQMRTELGRLRDRLHVTTVYVTHDQVEAMTLGDRVAVMRDGVIQQVATAQELFDYPVNVFVAGFIGSPEMNLVHAEASGSQVHFAEHVLSVPYRAEIGERRTVILGIRPTDFSRAPEKHPPTGTMISVRVEVIELLGAEMRVMFSVGARSAGELAGEKGSTSSDGDKLGLDQSAQVTAGHVTGFTASLPTDSSLTVGSTVDLVVDVSALHYFDPVTGVALTSERVPTPAVESTQ